MLEEARRQTEAQQKNVSLLVEELKAKLGLSKGIVETALQTTSMEIQRWQGENLVNLFAVCALPDRINIRPDNWQAVQDHAQRVSPKLAESVASAFTNLRFAEITIESVRNRKPQTSQHLGQGNSEVHRYLTAAKQDIEKAQQWLVQNGPGEHSV